MIVQVAAGPDPAVTLTEGIRSCCEYEVVVAAVLGQEYSQDAVLSFMTEPRPDAAHRLEPVVTTSVSGLAATWRGFERLSCVRRYAVTVCKEGNECPERLQLERDDAELLVRFSSSAPLHRCTDYSLHIKPQFGRIPLYEKVITFRTKAPSLSNLTSQLAGTVAETEGQTALVSWEAVPCAEQYRVYSRQQAEAAWQLLGVTSKNYYQHSAAPCSQYRFGVAVELAGQQGAVVQLGTSLTTSINMNTSYALPGLEVEQEAGRAVVSWSHRSCIQSYQLRCCPLNGAAACQEVEVAGVEGNQVEAVVGQLQPCTRYQLAVHPRTPAGQLPASPVQFTTQNPPARPPASVTVSLNRALDKVDIMWSGVECATGYRIHQRLQHSDTETVWISQNDLQLFLSLDSPEPCVNYRSDRMSSFIAI